MLQWTEFDISAGDGLRLWLVASDCGIRAIRFDERGPADGRRNDDHPLLFEAARQLRAYFWGQLIRFQLPLDMEGTEFQKRVWSTLETIPYGETRSYGQIAELLKRPSAVRAVGAANGSNPVPIVVPCHRVIGANGKLVGYGGGLPLKRWLLDFERHYSGRLLFAAVPALDPVFCDEERPPSSNIGARTGRP
jgi:methylated-DNA-[protein]-cysteine S-methyltransferase